MTIKLDSFIIFFLASSIIGVAISYSKLYLFHFALVLLIFILIKTKISNLKVRLPRLPTKLHYIFYFMFIWYFLSLFWSIKVEYTMIYLFYITCGISIILTLIYYMRTIEIQNKVFKILAIVFVIEITFSLLEAFTSFRLPISPFSNYVTYFGREMKMGDLDSDIITFLMQSPTGFQWNPNNLAVTFLIVSPFFLLHSNKWIKSLGILLILVLIIMSGSRGIFISFIFMLLLYMLFLSKKRFLIYVSILPLAFILFISSFESLKKSENQKIKEIATSFDVLMVYLFEEKTGTDSIGSRQMLIQNGIDALKSSNYVGVGGGGSVAVQENIGGVAGKLASMHNFWIEILVDSGVFFTIIFAFWYIYVVLKLYLIGIYTKKFIYRYYSQALFLSMSSFILGAVSASSVIYLFPMWIMFGFAISTINNYKRYKNETIITIRP